MAQNDINRKLQSAGAKVATLIAFSVGIFHILNVAGAISVSAFLLRAIHLMAMMVVALLMPPKKKTLSLAGYSFQIFYSLLTVVCSVYLFTRWMDIINGGGVTNTLDVAVAFVFVIIVLLATQRIVGTALAVISTVFLIYPFVAAFLPGILNGKIYSVNRVFSYMFTTSSGLYSTPISVSATYIILFCMYGAFLGEFGASDFLYRFAISLTNKLTAATAKTTIFFNLLIGMVSGSAAGNVAVTGSLTIPMMTKRGYTKEEAGAITAVAATGAQLMPPVMGAAAFIMAELIGIRYAQIMKAAIFSALLYFLALYFIVHLLSKKRNIDIPAEDNTNEKFIDVIKDGWYYIVPIVALIVLLTIGYSAFKAAYFSTLVLIGVYIISMLWRKHSFDKDILKKIFRSVVKGSRDTATMAVACAAAGVIVGVLNLTGLGSKLSMLITTISGDSMLIALILTMVVSLILGMGLPTTAAYLVLATVIVPALTTMGIPILSAHLFVFFFGCIAPITPPVALASYVAASIADADLNKVGWKAFAYGSVSFLLPYMFIYGPSLLLEGTFLSVIQTVIMSIIGIFVVAVALVGYFKVPLVFWQRAILFVAGLLMVMEGGVTDMIGIAISAVIFLMAIHKNKKLLKQN